ncbi:alpha/beta hydrolase [Desulfopila inferna]|uniref:alpha/beta hydrolase n=1 Tax=Desulfopila inferna TaxID=468528 RepID=UPI0019630940|nr:alpha/beta fold hydrolase [Desulfopila inferna]MBM9606110.1 alpha/beta fold hydrolase [Desulfopila inferna]
MTQIFLHGLDSSSKGTKGRFFKQNYPDCIIPDFAGSLEQRLEKLEVICRNEDSLLLIGSSFGGLMAACFAANHRKRVKRLILLAPALNFPGYPVPEERVTAPTYLLIGSLDQVTPANIVVPLAEKSFANLEVDVVDEDHLLHTAFANLDWNVLTKMN